MPRAIGANCRLLMIPEATYGTAPAGDWLRMPFLSCDLGAEQPLLDADVIGLGSSRDPAAPFLDTVTVQGQAVVPVDLVNIGHWLCLLLGPPTTTGSSPNFIHSFGSGAAALPSNSIEIGYPDVPNYDLCTGVRADTLEIDFSPTGPATATFGLMGQGSTRGASSSGGTPTSAA
ncbi:phage tail tube protein, partial [Roseomonas sp. DSM 102946]|nr:phage tail tube protein [Roseomonas sp. DSM 102946]